MRIAHPEGSDDYVPEAIAAARFELERRGVTKEAVIEVFDAIRDERAALEGRTEEPLSNRAWLAFILFGWVHIVTIPAVLLINAQGYRQKRRDAVGAIIWSHVLIMTPMMILIVYMLVRDLFFR